MPVTAGRRPGRRWCVDCGLLLKPRSGLQDRASRRRFRERVQRRLPMKVSDILRVKGSTLFTVVPEHLLGDAIKTMAEHDIGSLVVIDHGDLVGMLTFREVIKAVVRN